VDAGAEDGEDEGSEGEQKEPANLAASFGVLFFALIGWHGHGGGMFSHW
jgi:hypothetical protein